jgi:3-oxoacyl-[acyl-carrier protein] reductase
MRKRQWGRIICLTSIAAKQPVPGLILSTTARAGVLGFAKALSDEVAPDGITVNVVAPGYIVTERVVELNRARAQRERRTSEEIAKDVIRDIPVGRMGHPDELGAAVAFLASDRAGYITGAVLQVDGGYTRSIF